MNNSIIPLLIQPGLLITVVVIIHASLQVSVSVLTLLNGHSFRKKQAYSRLIRLNLAYVAGVISTSFLVLLGLQTVLNAGHTEDVSQLWPVIGFSMVVIGLVIMGNYYRRSKGTVLWLPRQQANYLSERAKKTKNPVEAAALGSMTVVAELPISLVLYLTIGLLSYNLADGANLWCAFGYSVIISLPLIMMVILVGGGHRVSQIQRWREQNKTFLKYSAGLGMLVAAIYIVSFYIMEAGL